ncbi:MAG: hypothetical protein ACO3JL_11990 [Myxococcota bacterium]
MSIFLIAGSLQTTMGRLLDENRRRIWAKVETASSVNVLTAVSVLFLFLGILSAYIAIVVLLTPTAFDAHFRAVLHLSGVDLTAELSAPERFSGISRWLRHNFSVAFVVFSLSFFYRAFGAALLLSWNAATWIAALFFLGRLVLLNKEGLFWLTILNLCTALVPHLLAESFGYCIVAISAIFASSGLAQYGSKDARLWQVLRAALLLLTIGLCIISIGAALEAYWAPFVLSQRIPNEHP